MHLAQVERRLERVRKDAKSKKEGAAEELEALEALLPLLDAGTPARKVSSPLDGNQGAVSYTHLRAHET